MTDKVSFEFDVFSMMGIDPPASGRRDLERQLKQLILDRVLEHCAIGSSPVRSGKWKKGLSKEYKKRKLAQGGSSIADMELTGRMLDELEVIKNSSGEFELRIQGKQASKADGHNNHSGRSSLPPREFIPKAGGGFKRSIVQDMRDLALEFIESEDR